MKYFKHTSGEVYAFEDDYQASDSNLVLMTSQEVNYLINPPLSAEEVLQTIEVSYENAINQNIDYMSHNFQADKESRLILSEVLSAGSVPAGFYWLDSSNTEVPMSFLELQGLASAMLVRNQTHFAHKQALKQQVALAINEADLLAITWSPPNG